MAQSPSSFNAGITYTLSNLLELPFTHPVALVLQYEGRFEYGCSKLLELDLNKVSYLKYPTRKDSSVLKVLSERQARSLQAVIAV